MWLPWPWHGDGGRMLNCTERAVCIWWFGVWKAEGISRLHCIKSPLKRYGGPVDADLQVCDHAIRQSCSHHATFPSSSSQSVAGSDWFTEVCAALPLLSCHVCLVMLVWCVNGAHRQAGSRILDTRIYTPPPVTHVNLDPAWGARPQQLLTYVHWCWIVFPFLADFC